MEILGKIQVVTARSSCGTIASKEIKQAKKPTDLQMRYLVFEEVFLNPKVQFEVKGLDIPSSDRILTD